VRSSPFALVAGQHERREIAAFESMAIVALRAGTSFDAF
jgi:hypothetical protein